MIEGQFWIWRSAFYRYCAGRYEVNMFGVTSGETLYLDLLQTDSAGRNELNFICTVLFCLFLFSVFPLSCFKVVLHFPAIAVSFGVFLSGIIIGICIVLIWIFAGV